MVVGRRVVKIVVKYGTFTATVRVYVYEVNLWSKYYSSHGVWNLLFHLIAGHVKITRRYFLGIHKLKLGN